MQTNRRLLLSYYFFMNTKEIFNNYQLLWMRPSFQLLLLLFHMLISNLRQNLFDISNGNNNTYILFLLN